MMLAGRGGQRPLPSNEGIVQGGMIPKLDNSFATLTAGVNEVIITKASNLHNLSLGTHLR